MVFEIRNDEPVFYLEPERKPKHSIHDKKRGLNFIKAETVYIHALWNLISKQDIRDYWAWVDGKQEENEVSVSGAPTSSPVSLSQLLSPQGLSYLKHQIEAIQFLMMQSSAILADEMGLGKTIEVIGLFNQLSLNAQSDILIVCPSIAKSNWACELKKWLVHDLSVEIIQGKEWKNANIRIVNYENLKDLEDQISRHYDIVVIDEGDRAINYKAKNAAVLYKGVSADRTIVMTGTPINNSEQDLANLWALATNRLIPVNISKQELKKRLGAIMLRRTKDEVLDLPKKSFEIVRLQNVSIVNSDSGIHRFGLDKSEQQADQELKRLKRKTKTARKEMAEKRKEVGTNKIPAMIEHVKSQVSLGKKVILFCHHKNVSDALYFAFKDLSVQIKGGQSQSKRDAVILAFQTQSEVSLAIVSTRAGGVAVNLTEADIAMIGEMDWKSTALEQAIARADRIGRNKPLLVQYLVAEGTFETHMIDIWQGKKELIGEWLNAV